MRYARHWYWEKMLVYYHQQITIAAIKGLASFISTNVYVIDESLGGCCSWTWTNFWSSEAPSVVYRAEDTTLLVSVEPVTDVLRRATVSRISKYDWRRRLTSTKTTFGGRRGARRRRTSGRSICEAASYVRRSVHSKRAGRQARRCRQDGLASCTLAPTQR